MKKIILLIIALMLTSQASYSIRKTVPEYTGMGYAKGTIHVGPFVGYGWGPAIGIDGEYGIMDKKWLAIGAGGNLAYHIGYTESYNSNYYWYNYNYSVTYSMFSTCVYATYHLFPHEKFDVIGKLGLGYHVWMTSESGDVPKSGWSYAHSSGVGEIAEAAIRYYLSDNIALKASVGWPVYIGAGVDFKFGGDK